MGDNMVEVKMTDRLNLAVRLALLTALIVLGQALIAAQVLGLLALRLVLWASGLWCSLTRPARSLPLTADLAPAIDVLGK